MNKINKRNRMKATAIAIAIVEGESAIVKMKMNSGFNPLASLMEMQIHVAVKIRTDAITRMPAKLFMANRPKLDKRRVKRYS